MNSNCNLAGRSRFSFIIGLVLIWCLSAGTSTVVAKDEGHGDTSELVRRGKLFRVAIDECYIKAIHDTHIKTGRELDISKIAISYIPINTSFDDAEIILRSAGFKVDPRPNTFGPGNRPDKHAVVASIDPYDHRFFSRIDVYVFLTPKNPGVYSEGVARISASIGWSYP